MDNPRPVSKVTPGLVLIVAFIVAVILALASAALRIDDGTWTRIVVITTLVTVFLWRAIRR